MTQVFTIQERYKEAIEVYIEALEFSPDNPEFLTTIGLLYLRLGENLRAFDYLRTSLVHDPKNPKTILAAGSIIQDHQVRHCMTLTLAVAFSLPFQIGKTFSDKNGVYIYIYIA